MGDGYLVVKNFEKFQHYKSKQSIPAWIKLHRSLLTDYDFHALPDAAKAHLMLIWLLVSQRNDRKVPEDPVWIARQIGANDPIDVAHLVEKGWLIRLDRSQKVRRPRLDHTRLDQTRSDKTGFPEGFTLFYAAYPRKKKRPDALKAWKQLSPEPGLALEITADAKVRFKNTEIGFVPYPASYLRGRQWEDPYDLPLSRNGHGPPPPERPKPVPADQIWKKWEKERSEK